MVWEHELYPLITEFKDFLGNYSLDSEFKEHLTAETSSWKEIGDGCVFWAPERNGEDNSISDSNIIRENIRFVLTRVLSGAYSLGLAQFWAPQEVGGRSILITSDQPFAIDYYHSKGLSRYRRKCCNHHYNVENGAEEEQLGPPGRVFRNGHPESSPNLRLYSAKEFPLRDYAAKCGLRSYLALPIFALHNQCVGVLEIVGYKHEAFLLLHRLPVAICDALKIEEMRTSHIIDAERLTNLWQLRYENDHGDIMCHEQQPTEIRDMLDLVLKAVPQLNLAHVMVPCEKCANSSNNFNCMKLMASVTKKTHRKDLLHDFSAAYRFHSLQNGKGIGISALSSANKSCFCQNISDFSVLEYPMAHYAQQASLSFCFAICLRNIRHSGDNSDLYVFEFFLQPQSRDRAYIWSVLCLLLKIMENRLRDFEIATGRQLADTLIVDEVRRKYISTSLKLGENSMFPFGFEVIPCDIGDVHQQQNIRYLEPMKGYDERYSFSEFREYLQKHFDCPQARESQYGFISCSMKDEELLKNGGNDNSMLRFQKKIRFLMSKIILKVSTIEHYLIQFWAPKTIKNRSYLSTSDQPFALGYLSKGIWWYRKKCMQHLYYVDKDNGAKDEELGPPGRVFLKGYPESSPDMRLYSVREFPLLVQGVYSGAREYLALPLFDLHKNQCFGVLEFVGFSYDWEPVILDELQKVNLRSTHINRDLSSMLALEEIKKMFELLNTSPQLQLAFAWTTCSQCPNMTNEWFCMERICDRWTLPFYTLKIWCRKVNIKKRINRRILESENKMLFLENIGDISILEQPWAHYAQEARLEFCFVICLHSAHTGNNLYVLEFFINPGSNRDGYPWSYLSFLLSTMKRNLKSFKVASGQQLGEHLLSQATGYGEKDQLLFKSVRHGHEIGQMKNFEREQNIIGTSSNEGNKRDESKTSFRISYKDLEPHFGKRLEDAANDLGVSRSTLKRARKECGIRRWPSNVKNKKNPTLFQTKTSNNYVQNLDPQISKASSSNLPISDYPIESNVPQTCNVTTREVDKTCQENNVVTIKAKFKEDIVKFDLCLSSGLEKLVEEVAKRLHLLPGNFKLKYKDDDDDLIWLTCDEDWHNHVTSMRSLGKTTVHVLVHLVSN